MMNHPLAYMIPLFLSALITVVLFARGWQRRTAVRFFDAIVYLARSEVLGGMRDGAIETFWQRRGFIDQDPKSLVWHTLPVLDELTDSVWSCGCGNHG